MMGLLKSTFWTIFKKGGDVMSINGFQTILIGLWTAFCFSGMLLGIYTNRCIVLSFGVGIILGDLPTACNGSYWWIGLYGIRCWCWRYYSTKPNRTWYLGTLMAITSAGKVSPKRFLPLSPIAVAIQFLQTFTTVRAGAPETTMKHLKTIIWRNSVHSKCNNLVVCFYWIYLGLL